DPAILRQGLVNLLDNAIKYTPRAGAIRLAVSQPRSGEVAIEVQDSGPGIAAVHQGRIFERFYRVDDARSRAHGRAGLGLGTARWTRGRDAGRGRPERHAAQTGGVEGSRANRETGRSSGLACLRLAETARMLCGRT